MAYLWKILTVKDAIELHTRFTGRESRFTTFLWPGSLVIDLLHNCIVVVKRFHEAKVGDVG